MSRDQEMTIIDAMVRGILIGGSVGALAGVLDIIDLRRAIFLGMCVGILGAVTAYKRSKR